MIRIEVGEVDELDDPGRYYEDDATRVALPEKVRERGRTLFIEALDMLDSCCEAVSEKFAKKAGNGPSEIEMRMALQLDGKAGAKFVELGASAHMDVVMRWKDPSDDR
ncbi:hypothetical protein Snas_3595 [Stackebrandtia nassauensis DSM 44728]|uniref:Trypsin-co-occurring domain-containing protein n=2 Tax=Stackebrandtia TaxID=283810 RepID=D3PWN3_STANL|nr:hypothetical protein Snas_3595 [Stackebrandtia nassauensis DSM 44728]